MVSVIEGFHRTPYHTCIHICHLTVRDCGQPSNPGPNGEVSVGETTFGSVANYSCNLGYRLVPENNARLCQVNETWSGMDPMCQSMLLLLHTYLLLTVNSADCICSLNQYTGMCTHTIRVFFLEI